MFFIVLILSKLVLIIPMSAVIIRLLIVSSLLAGTQASSTIPI
jgi:hypothetical protein